MLKRKEFILGAAVGLTFAAAATAGGVIQWPGANAQTPVSASSRLIPTAGAAGLAFQPPPGAPLSFANIFEQVSPAVVQIEVKTRVQRPQGGAFQIPGLPFSFPMPPGAESEEGAEPQGRLVPGAGSGFFISANGYIVTNNHVVADAEEITVKLSDERELKGTLVGRDESTDLAVIKVEGTNFSFVDFEESAEPRVGDWVIAVGNPFGLGGTATAGIVSARARDLRDQSSAYVDYLQIDAAINQGNSGGPTFDIYGRVIGVNTAIFSPTGASVGIGFAIPASTAKSITDRLMRGEAIERGYLGVAIQTFTPDKAAALGLPAGFAGAEVGEVTPGGPAAAAGLQPDDVITSINGEAIETSTELTRAVSNAKVNDQLRLEVYRDGRKRDITVRAGRRPSELELRSSQSGGSATPEGTPAIPEATTVEGMGVVAITPALRERFSIPPEVTGVVVTAVTPGSKAAEILQPGMVIRRANNQAVTTAADLTRAVAAARAANRPGVLLSVRAGSTNGSIVLELDKPSEN